MSIKSATRNGAIAGEKAADKRELRRALQASGLVPGTEAWNAALEAGTAAIIQANQRRERERQESELDVIRTMIEVYRCMDGTFDAAEIETDRIHLAPARQE